MSLQGGHFLTFPLSSADPEPASIRTYAHGVVLTVLRGDQESAKRDRCFPLSNRREIAMAKHPNYMFGIYRNVII